VLECVVNISEGRRPEVVAAIAATAGRDLLDVHRDPDHHRSVLTVLGEAAPRAIARAAVATLDLRDHDGVHPRIGVLDVVPFVPLDDATMAEAIAARDRFGAWAAAELALPCFLYGPERSLPELRRDAFRTLVPDVGPSRPHPTAGAAAVGARPLLVAYNLWLADADLASARALARAIRQPAVRALGLQVGPRVQLSMNLVAPDEVGPADVYDWTQARTAVAGAELVGLLPLAVLVRIDRERWAALDLGEERTIEARRAAAGRG